MSVKRVEAAPAPQELWADDDLIAVFQPGRGNALVVCFPTSGTFDQANRPLAPPPNSIFDDERENSVLYVRDYSWGWLAKPGQFDRAVEFIERAAERSKASNIVAFGASAGGTSALLIHARFRFDGLLAISPQLDLGNLFRAFDPRHRKWLQYVPDNLEIPPSALNLLKGIIFSSAMVFAVLMRHTLFFAP
jgi:hypothetical protein